MKRVGMQELGPKFTLKLRSLQQGTFDSKYGEYLWRYEVTEVMLEDKKHSSTHSIIETGV
jgi:hypothetical protein